MRVDARTMTPEQAADAMQEKWGLRRSRIIAAERAGAVDREADPDRWRFYERVYEILTARSPLEG